MEGKLRWFPQQLDCCWALGFGCVFSCIFLSESTLWSRSYWVGDRLRCQNWPMKWLLLIDEELEILENNLLRLHGKLELPWRFILIADWLTSKLGLLDWFGIWVCVVLWRDQKLCCVAHWQGIPFKFFCRKTKSYKLSNFARGFALIALKLSFLMPGLFLIWFFFLLYMKGTWIRSFLLLFRYFACYARSYGKSNFPFMKIVLLPDSPLVVGIMNFST